MGDVCPGVGRQLGSFCARLSAGSSRSALGGGRFEQLRESIAASFDGCGDWMERVVLYEPFDAGARPGDGRRAARTSCVSSTAPRARPLRGGASTTPPPLRPSACGAAWPKNAWPAELDEEVAARVFEDEALAGEVAALRAVFRAPPDPCFVHTDTRTGNVLVDGAGGMFTIDYEFGQLGPRSFDIGHVLGVGFMCALAVQGLAAAEADGEASARPAAGPPSARPPQPPPAVTPEARRRQLAWLTSLSAEAWEGYLAASAAEGDGRRPPPSPSSLAEALGYAGATMMRWGIGEWNLFTMLSLPPDAGAARVAAVRRAVCLGTTLIVRRGEITSVREAQRLLECALEWDGSGTPPPALRAG